MSAVDACGKCLPRGATNALKMDATCDLSPMKGFNGPCALKFNAGIIDQDDGETHTGERRRNGKARPNARMRKERKANKVEGSVDSG